MFRRDRFFPECRKLHSITVSARGDVNDVTNISHFPEIADVDTLVTVMINAHDCNALKGFATIRISGRLANVKNLYIRHSCTLPQSMRSQWFGSPGDPRGSLAYPHSLSLPHAVHSAPLGMGQQGRVHGQALFPRLL